MEKLRRFWSVTAYSLLPLGLLIPGQRRAFPRAQEIEPAEFLIESHGLVTHPLFSVVVADLDKTGHRKVLAQRVAFEAVIGQNAPQVRMAIKQHAEQVINLALVPVRPRIDSRRTRDRRVFVGRDLDPDPPVQPRRQQMIDDIEPLLALRIIGPRNIDDRNEFSGKVLAEALDEL